MKIESIGYYLPASEKITNIIKKFPEAWQFPIQEKTGIKEIRKASLGEYSLSLSLEAVRKCLSISSYKLANIDAIICCNICKYDAEDVLTIEPATAASVAQHFGMKDVQCLDVSNACAGMFTGLYLAKSMLSAGEVNNVLVVSGEYITKLGETTLKESQSDTSYDPSELLATLTLGDSAVAMIVDRSEEGIGFTDIQLKTYGEHSDLCTGYPIANGPIMITQSKELAFRASNYSAVHTLKTIQQNNWCNEDIRFLIPHQTAEKVIDLGVSLFNKQVGSKRFNKDNTLVNLENRGNTSTTTHFVALMDKMLEGEIGEGDKLIFSISASGITIGTALYTMDSLAQRIKLRLKGRNKISNNPKSAQKVAVSDVTMLPEDYKGPTQTFAMAATVLKETLRKHKVTDKKIGLLIFTGLYVTGHISEPAIAAMLLKEAGVSPEEQALHFSENLFAFDIKNGAIGTQKAINAAAVLMQHHQIDQSLIVTSDIYDEEMERMASIPIQTAATSLLLSNTSEGGLAIMKHQEQFNFWKYFSEYESAVVWNKNEIGLNYLQSLDLRIKYLRCVKEAVVKFFKKTNTSWKDYDNVTIPFVSRDLVNKASEYFPDLPLKKLIEICQDKDFFNAQIPIVLQKWKEETVGGSILLQIQVASGIQVCISVWEKK